MIRVSAMYMVAVWVHYIRDLLFWPAVVFLVLNTGNDYRLLTAVDREASDGLIVASVVL